MEDLDLDTLAALLYILSPAELNILFLQLVQDVSALGFDLTLPTRPTVQNTIFLAQLLAKYQQN